MTVRFLADEDLDASIIRGLHSREPAIDILDVKTAGLRGTADSEILEIAAQQDRILITYDQNTMTRYYRERLDAGLPAPGMFILPQQSAAIGTIIESLLLAWTASQSENGGIRWFICPSGERTSSALIVGARGPIRDSQGGYIRSNRRMSAVTREACLPFRLSSSGFALSSILSSCQLIRIMVGRLNRQPPSPTMRRLIAPQ